MICGWSIVVSQGLSDGSMRGMGRAVGPWFNGAALTWGDAPGWYGDAPLALVWCDGGLLRE